MKTAMRMLELLEELIALNRESPYLATSYAGYIVKARDALKLRIEGVQP